jgi:hypothetical protein
MLISLGNAVWFSDSHDLQLSAPLIGLIRLRGWLRRNRITSLGARGRPATLPFREFAGLLVRGLHPQGLAFRAVCLRGQQTMRAAFRSLPILPPEVSPASFSCRFQTEPPGKRRSKHTFSHITVATRHPLPPDIPRALCHFPRTKNCSILNIVLWVRGQKRVNWRNIAISLIFRFHTNVSGANRIERN